MKTSLQTLASNFTTLPSIRSLAVVAALVMVADSASAQNFGNFLGGRQSSAGSWVDIGNAGAGAGAEASGVVQFAKSKTRVKNGTQFGHGFAVGAGPNGIALSHSIGAGTGPLGAAHNVNLNIGPGGTHVSHGGVVSEGGNRRVISGGSTSSQNGFISGGSESTGWGNNTNAYSKSRTRHWIRPSNRYYRNR